MVRSFHRPGRSAVYAVNAMAATSMPEATLAALDMLRAGGNALDGAITAAAVLGVVEPQSTGIGGDCFCLYKPHGKPLTALNGSGRSPAGLSMDALKEAEISELSPISPHTVTIPGALSAWEALLAAHGRKGLDEVLQPAIRFAEEGYVVAPRVALDWQIWQEKLRAAGTHDLLFDNAAPSTGQLMRLPALAATLRKIASGGAKAFYEGELAAAMVQALRARGGLHTEPDFANGLRSAEFVPPISTTFAGHNVWECPPNGSGVVALMIMAILDGFTPEAGADPLDPLRLHRHIEAARLAYRDRDAFLADPVAMPVSVAQLLSPNYIIGLRSLIDDEMARSDLPPPGELAGNTVYISVVDEDGNACSFINSLFQEFGSGIMAPATGVLLHSRGRGFRMQRGHPNCIGPNKRPMHTIIPSMATKAERAELVFGVMGAHYQPMGQSWVLSNILQYGCDPQEAIDLPRFFPYDGKVEVEDTIPAALRAALAAKGHIIAADLPIPHGGAQAIRIDHERGILIGGSDPRKDGCALGY
jgi:gamma-glutamyltranspeptidase/glutathione hydrolase